MPIADVRVPIVLDRARTMIFNANTMCAYEEATGKPFLDAIACLYDVVAPVMEIRKQARLAQQAAQQAGGETAAPEIPLLNPFDLVRAVPMKTLRALVWAALHEYDANDDPHWPLTLNQVGRYITIENVTGIFMGFMSGQIASSPSKEELGESPAGAPSGGSVPQSSGGSVPPKSEAVLGGERSIELPVDAFTSMSAP